MLLNAYFIEKRPEIYVIMLTVKDTSYARAKNEHLLYVLLHNFVSTRAIKNLNAFFLISVRPPPFMARGYFGFFVFL